MGKDHAKSGVDILKQGSDSLSLRLSAWNVVEGNELSGRPILPYDDEMEQVRAMNEAVRKGTGPYAHLMTGTPLDYKYLYEDGGPLAGFDKD